MNRRRFSITLGSLGLGVAGCGAGDGGAPSSTGAVSPSNTTATNSVAAVNTAQAVPSSTSPNNASVVSTPSINAAALTGDAYFSVSEDKIVYPITIYGKNFEKSVQIEWENNLSSGQIPQAKTRFVSPLTLPQKT
jgi:hypothetical protein